MKAVLRAVVAAILVSLVLAGVAAAADLPTVGGQIDAYPDKTIVITSHGNVPAHVTLSSETVGLSEASFDLAPEGTHKVTYTGDPVGSVVADFVIIKSASGDVGSATLVLGLKPYVKPFGFGDFGPGGRSAPLWIVLIILAVAFLMWRVKPWRFRLVRAA